MSSSIRTTLDRDALKLVFRNALAQDDVRNSPAALITRLAATSKASLDAIVRVLSQFRVAELTTDEMTLERESSDDDDEEDHAITITPPQFGWMVRWGMIYLKSLVIPSKGVGNWWRFVQLFVMPSLRKLEISAIGESRETYAASMYLVSGIVTLNASSVRELHHMPVWELSATLPKLQLDKFVYEPWKFDREGLDNLSTCVVKLLVVDLRYFSPKQGVPLDTFAKVNAEEISFSLHPTATCRFHAPAETTNEHVRRIHIELKGNSVDVDDIKALHGFFPKLTRVKLDVDLNNESRRSLLYLPKLQEIGAYLASSPALPALDGRVHMAFTEHPRMIHGWSAQNVSAQYDRLLKIRDAIALVPRQLEVCATSTSKFSRVGVAQNEADVGAIKLGFQKPTGKDVIYKHNALLAPGRTLTALWTVI